MKNIFFGSFLLLLLLAGDLFAYPDTERAVLSSITTQGADFLIDSDNRYLYLGFTSNIKRIDLQTWALTTDQVPALTDSKDSGADLQGNIGGLALRNTILYATQDDGDLVKIDLSDITNDDPDVYSVTTGNLGDVVADTDTGTSDDKLYIADLANEAILVYDLSDRTTTSVPLLDDLSSSVQPGKLALVQFPTPAGEGGETDAIYAVSNEGFLYLLNEGATTASSIDVDSLNGDDLSALAVSPDRNFLLVTDASDTTVRIFSTLTNTELDTDGNSSNGVTPVALSQNAGLSNIVVASVKNPDDTYAYVSGTNGVSVIDLHISGTTLLSADVLDLNDEGISDDEDDPMSITGTPGPLVASSKTNGYMISSNAGGALSVISEKPFVTISGTTLLNSVGAAATTLGSGGTVALTFQSDETGTYSVRLGGDTTASGTEIASGTVTTADTDLTTAAINYSSSFSEGANRLFVFVTDADTLLGWDAVDVTVDTPPPAVTINSVGFGSGAIYANFNRLSDTDIDHYNIYAETTQAAAAASTNIRTTQTQPGSGSSTIQVKVSGLTNETSYFAGVEAVDATGNIGTRTTGATYFNTPTATVGILGASGEVGGCTLIPGR